MLWASAPRQQLCGPVSVSVLEDIGVWRLDRSCVGVTWTYAVHCGGWEIVADALGILYHMTAFYFLTEQFPGGGGWNKVG